MSSEVVCYTLRRVSLNHVHDIVHGGDFLYEVRLKQLHGSLVNLVVQVLLQIFKFVHTAHSFHL